MSDEQISEAFDLIRQYAEREGWVPIGFREWRVGPWRIRVNGTPGVQEHIPAFAALVEHEDIIGYLMVHPFGGTMAGSATIEDRFIAAMKTELAPAGA